MVRLNELANIRQFLTGTALTVILDGIFAVIYIGVMLLYSLELTVWALIVIPLFVGVTYISSPIIKRQLRQQAEANARVQSHLVETVSGMETVKGQSMEIHSRWRWQQLYGGSISSGFRRIVTNPAGLQQNFSGNYLASWLSVGASIV